MTSVTTSIALATEVTATDPAGTGKTAANFTEWLDGEHGQKQAGQEHTMERLAHIGHLFWGVWMPNHLARVI